MSRHCFDLISNPSMKKELLEQYETYINKGMPDLTTKQLETHIAMNYYEKLHSELNSIKRELGLAETEHKSWVIENPIVDDEVIQELQQEALNNRFESGDLPVPTVEDEDRTDIWARIDAAEEGEIIDVGNLFAGLADDNIDTPSTPKKRIDPTTPSNEEDLGMFHSKLDTSLRMEDLINNSKNITQEQIEEAKKFCK